MATTHTDQHHHREGTSDIEATTPHYVYVKADPSLREIYHTTYLCPSVHADFLSLDARDPDEKRTLPILQTLQECSWCQNNPSAF